MTSRRQRDLGPILAIAGAAIAILAIIAGFIVVGGPGTTRDERLDDLTERQIDNALSVVQCAFNATGKAPATLAEAARVAGFRIGDHTRGPCREATDSALNEVSDGAGPDHPGEVAYASISEDTVRLCGYFRVARKSGEPNCASSYFEMYSVLDEQRPAGRHCYEIHLENTPALEMRPPGGHRPACAIQVFH